MLARDSMGGGMRTKNEMLPCMKDLRVRITESLSLYSHERIDQTE